MLSEFIKFCIPSVLAQWVFALYTMVDGIFVAKGVSETALSAVNIASPFLNFLFSISLMFAVGSSTIIAIFLGQENNEKAETTYTQNTIVLAFSSVFIMVFALLNLDKLAIFLGATAVNLEMVKTYIKTLAFFSPFFMLTYLYEILVKVDGAPKLSMVAVASGALINLLLDYIFVMIFKWGIFGAAFATGISQAIVLFIYFAYMRSKRATLRLRKGKFDIKLQLRTFKLGLSSGITEWSAGVIIFLFNNAILRNIGEEQIISYTVSAYVSTLAVMSMAGIAQGFSPLVSRYYGKNDFQTCRKLLNYGLISGSLLSIIFMSLSFLFAKPIVLIYVQESLFELVNYSVVVLKIFSISFIFAGINVLISGYFTAIEKAFNSLVISVCRGFITPIISLIILPKILGEMGVWYSAIFSEILCLIVTVFLFRKLLTNSKFGGKNETNIF